MSPTNEHKTAIEGKFAEIFSTWGVELPPGAVSNRANGVIQKDGWTIRFIFGSQAGENFLEYYATHRMTSDTRKRIYESGRVETLEAIQSLFVYRPGSDVDKEQAEKTPLENNRRIAEELTNLKLYPVGEMNAALRIGNPPDNYSRSPGSQR